MKGVISAIKANSGTVAGVLGGFFVSGVAVNSVQSLLTPILGAKSAKFGQAAAAGAITIAAFFGATRVKSEFMKDAMVGFGAVSLGHAVNGLMSAFGTSSNTSS